MPVQAQAPEALDVDVPVVSRPSSSAIASGRVQADAFQEALQAVEVLREVHYDIAPSASNTLTANADQLVLKAVEEEQAEDDSAREALDAAILGNDHRAAHVRETGGGRLAQAVNDGELPLHQEVHDMAHKGPSSPRRAASEGSSSSDPPPVSELAQVASKSASFCRFLGRLVRLVWSHFVAEFQMLLLLVPYAVAFTAQGLTDQWRVWISRPLYALVIARVAVGLVFSVVNNPTVIEQLPVRVTVFIDAFMGWPSIAIAWQVLISIFYYVTPLTGGFPDQAAWDYLRAQDFLVGINVWIAVVAVSRGLLDLFASGMFSKLQTAHFEERVERAILFLRVFRVLLAESRRVRLRMADRSRRNADRSQHKPESAKIDGQLFAADLDTARSKASSRSNSSMSSDDDWSALQDGLEIVRHALTLSSGFVSSITQARKYGVNSFRALVADITPGVGTAPDLARYADDVAPSPLTTTSSVDGPYLPRRRLEDLCDRAMRRRSGRFRAGVHKAILDLFPVQKVSEADYVAALERAYKEQRYIRASVDSFDQISKHVRSFLVMAWGVIVGAAGVFLLDWGVDLQSWILPLSSTLLSAALVLGFLPYETISGILYVLVVRPYDVGDRICVNQPGLGCDGVDPLVVSEISLTYTKCIAWNGEYHTLMNHIVRRLGTINMNRSASPVLKHVFQVPTSTPPQTVSEIIDAIRAYVARTPEDWIGVEAAFIREGNYERGHLEIWMMIQCRHRRHIEDQVDGAKGRLYLFYHSYLLAAGLEYLRPTQRVRATVVHEHGPGAADGGAETSAGAAAAAAAAAGEGGETAPPRAVRYLPATRATLWGPSVGP